VMAKDFMFAPTALTVAAGSTVTWTNEDDEPHSTRASRSASINPAPIATCPPFTPAWWEPSSSANRSGREMWRDPPGPCWPVRLARP
jgi:plastocyanin